MSQQMDAPLQALCYFYRHPPVGSGVRPQPYSEIAKLIKRPHMPVGTIRQSVRRFKECGHAVLARSRVRSFALALALAHFRIVILVCVFVGAVWGPF